jgi:radical SAM-linked protein
VRARFRFTKLGKVRWTSHRDVARMWERALRRVRMPVAYSGGFAPRPRIAFGLALPTGCESVAEYLDVELAEPAAVDPGELSAALPVGVDVTAWAVLDGDGGSLQEQVTSCTWLVDAGPDAAELAAAVRDAPSLVVTRERKGREVTDDLRPAVLGLEADGRWLVVELATRPRGVRPGELLAAVRPGVTVGCVRRTHQWIERDGARFEPLPVADGSPEATAAPHARLRAS